MPSGSALFDVTVDASELAHLLERYERRFSDLSAPLSVVAEMLVSSV